MLEEDTEFVNYLSFKDLQDEYRTKKKELIQNVERRYKEEESSLRAKKLEEIETDKSHRMVLNACIFPFSQESPLSNLGYYFIRASPLAELGVTNLDFLLFHPDPDVSAIFGEVKSQLNDPKGVVDQTKKRIKAVFDNKSYIQENYLKKLDAELEFVLGVWMSDTMELAKTIMRKGGDIKVWGTGPQINSMQPELSFIRPWEGREVGKSMFHKNNLLNQKLSHIETSWDFKSIFLDSHIFAKLSLLAWVGEKKDGSFKLDDLFEIVKEELEYLEIEKIRTETENILSIGEKIGFIEKITEKPGSYEIKSRAKKADTKEEEIKRKWVNFSIEEDIEAEKEERLKKLQEEFREKRIKQRTLSEYT